MRDFGVRVGHGIQLRLLFGSPAFQALVELQPKGQRFQHRWQLLQLPERNGGGLLHDAWLDGFEFEWGNPRFTQIGWEFDIFLFDPEIPSLKLKVPRFECPKKHKKSNVPTLKRKGGMGWRFVAKALIEISSKCQGD